MKLSLLSLVPVVAQSASTFFDDFDVLNPQYWTQEQGGHGWGNYELQTYTDQNAHIEFDNSINSNVMVIEARPANKESATPYNCWYGLCEFTSARVISKGKLTVKYGRIEARMKLPQTQGVWPAFWLLGSNLEEAGWPTCGEIDIMEHKGNSPTLTSGALHGPGYFADHTPFIALNNMDEVVDQNYHVYGVDWNADRVQWLIDGRVFYQASRDEVNSRGQWAFDNEMFVLFNFAVGGTFPGNPDHTSVFPQKMYVDWIKIENSDIKTVDEHQSIRI